MTMAHLADAQLDTDELALTQTDTQLVAIGAVDVGDANMEATVMAGDGWMAGDGTAMTRQHSSWHDFVTLHSYKKRRIAKNLRVAPWHHFGTGLPCYFFITYYPLEERHLLQWPTHEPDVQSLMGQIQQICDTE